MAVATAADDVAFPRLVIVHALAATVWTGVHLILTFGVLSTPLREGSGAPIGASKASVAPLGFGALVSPVVSGAWMGSILLPGLEGLLRPGHRLWILIDTSVLALHARPRLIPARRDATLGRLAWHIRGVTSLAIAFVVAGALIRLGALG